MILAGGKRVLNETGADHPPKLLEKINSHQVLHYVIQAAGGIQAMKVVGTTVVVSTRFEDVLRNFLQSFPKVVIAVQESHRGTADAVWQAIEQGFYPKAGQADYVLVLMGDQPLITSRDLDIFCTDFVEAKPLKRAGILTFMGDRHQNEFHKCGVVIRDPERKFINLQSRIPLSDSGAEELHAGPYIFESDWLRGLLTVLSEKQQSLSDDAPEFHLYDPLRAAAAEIGVHTVLSNQPENFLGVDTMSALKEVRKRMKKRLS